MSGTRVEHDLLGDLEVPERSLYGVHTRRAVDNFPLSGRTVSELTDLVHALATVKQAAALANRDVGVLDPQIASAIVQAAVEVRSGRWHEQFPVDVMQGGAGTSTNMNVNEVIANRALQLLGREPGDYAVVHPNDHVNLGQSTNDAYPTAVRLACYAMCLRLEDALAELVNAFEGKAREYEDVLKIGRTQLQEAVPMTVGQEMRAYAALLAAERASLSSARAELCNVNLGGTAIGTGINAAPGYQDAAVAHLRELTGLPLGTASDQVAATQDTGAFVRLSSALRQVAVKLSKVCNDLRLLSSGPRAGLAEISLRPMQAGSSIMPGKVNPVIPEAVNQVAFRVIGNDLTVTMAGEAGQLQLNAFEPVIITVLTESLQQLHAGCSILATRCVHSIVVDTTRTRDTVDSSIGLATAFAPRLGYAAASALAAKLRTGTTGIRELLRADHGLTDADIDAILAGATGHSPTPANHRCTPNPSADLALSTKG
jgi:aspartate ammonia-lyase